MEKKAYPLISGFGSYVPPRIVTNDDLATIVDTSDEWIVSRTGIRTRHIADEGVTNADFGFEAAKESIKKAGIDKKDITHVLYGTCTPDAAMPSSACLMQAKLGIKGTLAIDFNAACASFVYGLELAHSITKVKPEAVVLLVATDILSQRLNWNDRTTCVLFGDGSGAAIVTGEKSSAKLKQDILKGSFVDIICSSDGSLADLLYVKGGHSSHPYKMGDIVGEEYFLHMEGRTVFKHAVRKMSKMCRDILDKNHLKVEEIDRVIPHQANIRIIEAVGSRLEADSDKIFINVDKIGNTSAASIPLALSQAVDGGFVQKGHKVLLVTFGSGFTWGSAIIQF